MVYYSAMRHLSSRCFFLLALIAILAIPVMAYPQAVRITDHNAAAAGQGNAFVAQADDPSAIYFNPAGMTQLSGVQVLAGVTLLNADIDFRSPEGATAQGDFNGTIAFPPPSHFYITANMKDLGFTGLSGLTVGLGVLSPFGTVIDYPDDGPFSTARTFANLPLVDIKPTVAYKVNDSISVGLGADVYTFASFLGEGHYEIQQNIPGPSGNLLPAEVNGSDTAAGFNVSLMYTPLRNDAGNPLVNIGLVYRTQATLHLAGEFLVNGGRVDGATTTLVVPQVFTGGIGVWPLRDNEKEWKLELDVDVTGWKSLRNLDAALDNGVTLPSPRDWRNATTILLGTEYKWLQLARLPEWEIALRGGYGHYAALVPDRTFDPAIPDAEKNVIAIGAGFLCSENGTFLGLFRCGGRGGGLFSRSAVGLDVGYQVHLFEPRTVVGNLNPTVDGTYKTIYHAGSVSLRVNF